MTWIAKFLRYCAKLRFKVMDLATIKDIPTEKFHRLTATLISSGWRKTFEYDGFDAWIDYGRIDLRKGRCSLKLEWDNWDEGSIEGPRAIVEGIARETGMALSNKWRWG